MKHLQKYEHSVIADALESFEFPAGSDIIKEGDSGEHFYIITEGTCQVTQLDTASGKVGVVGKLTVGAYFGEIALLTDRPRQATVTAVTGVRAVGLDRGRFTRVPVVVVAVRRPVRSRSPIPSPQVLGPCENLLRRNIALYNRYVASTI